ncbi:MAG: hypothetical protein IJ136_06485 [Erysipelotrichaceae bacterium]|nr:hypothetical protein [Erysipelotrichaceae bacterium]
MKKIVCELCGSNELIKEGDYFICKYCGTKYSPEQAKKLTIEGKVDVSGSTVKIDKSAIIDNLYGLARKAREEKNAENGERYYSEILVENPDDWEAYFYSTYYKCMQCKIIEIEKASALLQNCLFNTCKLFTKNTPKNVWTKIIIQLTEDIVKISLLFVKGATDHFNKYYVAAGTPESMRNELRNRIVASISLLSIAQDYFSTISEDEDVKRFCNIFAETEIDILSATIDYFHLDPTVQEQMFQLANFAEEKIKKFEPNYKKPDKLIKKSGGCYIATFVYGSYDCPEVWTLRRYRDYSLAETWYGRIFIKAYYAISPKLVKICGKTEWFKKMWKPALDRMVQNLIEKGYSTEPYQDKQW